MPSSKLLKERIESIQDTQKITNAKNIPASPSTAFTIGSPKNAALLTSVAYCKTDFFSFGYML